MKDYTIRPLTEADTPALKPLLLQLARHHNEIAKSFSGVYPQLPPDSIVSSMEEHVSDKTAYLIGAFLPNGMLAGFGMASIERTYGEVDYLAVHEDMRGKGIGGALLESMLEYLENAGATLVDLKVVNGNPARSFYEKHGFALRSHILARKMNQE